MNQTSNAAALQGDALHAFIDQAHELLNDYDEDQSTINREERMAAAAELMEQQNFAPASVNDLERVHDFWLMLDKPEIANRFLQAHRQSALHTGERQAADAQVRIALSDIQSRLGFDKTSAVALLKPTAQAIAQLPADMDTDRYWHGWQWMAEEAQAWEIAETGVDLHRARERSDPDNETYLAYGDAMALVRKAELAHKRGNAGAATGHVHNAIQTLRDAAPEQSVDFEQWMELADRALPVATASLPSLLMACEQQLERTENPPPSPAVKAHRKVRILRLQAQACALAGQLEAALQLAPLGRVSLTDDQGDPFSALHLTWLMQAQRLDEAAALALESVLHARPISAVAACKLAQQRFDSNVDADTGRAITWALILAMVHADTEMHYLFAQEKMPSRDADFYLDFVRAREPRNLLLALTQGMRHAAKRQMEQALPLLEQSVGQRPDLADGDKLSTLWAARFAVLPLEEALALPFPESHGAHWCYATGVTLDHDEELAPLLGGKKKLPPSEVRSQLALRYYEESLRRFENFWATGLGAFKDADLHVYSMLCNNLAIKYRFQSRYDEAAALHHKGLASSPFAEHHNSLVWCAIGKDDYSQTVTEAERLWHFAQEHGYGRHDPPRYLPSVAYALYRLDRDDEISIWTERLDQWFHDLSEAEQRNERRDYLAALMAMLDFFSITRPALVLPRLRSHQQEVIALRDCYPLRRLACALEAYPELLEESLALHRQAHSYLGKNDDENEHRVSREGIERAEAKLAERDAAASGKASSGSKPWWKFW